MHRKNGPAKAFYFKQFQINHDRCAMKVGTDGVLLGSWANINGGKKILDIGTGSGLIALMMAQRSGAQTCIEAVEIDYESFQQACDNVKASPWNDRIKLFHTPLQSFHPNHDYDLILCNPPFFVNSLKPNDKSRTTSRHSDQLPFSEIIRFTKGHLSPDGSLQLILPLKEGNEFVLQAARESLFCVRRTEVKSRQDKPVERLLLEFSRQSKPTGKATLVLENKDGTRAVAFHHLVADFYL